MDLADRSKKRSRSEKPEDKYKDEKEYWMVEKALKFAQNQQKDKKEQQIVQQTTQQVIQHQIQLQTQPTAQAILQIQAIQLIAQINR